MSGLEAVTRSDNVNQTPETTLAKEEAVLIFALRTATRQGA